MKAMAKEILHEFVIDLSLLKNRRKNPLKIL